MRFNLLNSCFAALLATLLGGGSASAQFEGTVIGDPATPLDFTDGANWEIDFGGGFVSNTVPNGNFNEFAFINHGGVIFVEDALSGTSFPPAPGGLFLGAAAGTVLEIRDTGSLTFVQPAFPPIDVDRSALINGALSVQGAGFLDADSVTFNPGSTLSIDVTASTDRPIRALGATPANGTLGASFGGSLALDFSGVANPLGTTVLAEATAVSNSLTSVTATGLGANQAVAVSAQEPSTPGGSAFLNATVFNQLVLTVDRDTQEVAIFNPHNVAVELDGFSVQSDSGSLNGAAFTGTGFAGFESFPSSDNIVGQVFEGPTVGSPTFSIPANSTTVIGAQLFERAAPSAFQADPEDLVFEITAPNSVGLITFEGAVEFTGTEAPIDNDIVLTIDSSGEAVILNQSAFSQEIEAYRITSADGSLITANWNSLADQLVDGGIWSEASFSDANTLLEVTEGEPGGVTATTFANEAAGLFNLGQIFDTAGDQSGITFEFLLEGDSELTVGSVVFGDLPVVDDVLVADFNDDGLVNAADFTVLRDSFGAAALLNRDPANVGPVGVADFDSFAANFGASASTTSPVLAPVPEPSSLVLGMPLLAMLFSKSSRRRSLA